MEVYVVDTRQLHTTLPSECKQKKWEDREEESSFLSSFLKSFLERVNMAHVRLENQLRKSILPAQRYYTEPSASVEGLYLPALVHISSRGGVSLLLSPPYSLPRAYEAVSSILKEKDGDGNAAATTGMHVNPRM